MLGFDKDLIRLKLKDGSFTIDDIDYVLSILGTEQALALCELFDQYLELNKSRERSALTISEIEQMANQIFKSDH